MRETFYHLPLPMSLSSLALICDLHERPYGPIIRSLRARRPQIICVAGDLICGHADPYAPPVAYRILPFLRALTEIAPTFLSLGNHEWMLTERDMRILETSGVTILDDRFVRFGSLCLGGLTSRTVTEYRALREKLDVSAPYPEWRHHRTKNHPDCSWLETFSRQDGFRILLSHHPEYVTDIRRAVSPNGRIDLILSGHAHGGQISLFGQGLFAPGQGFLPRYTHGVYDGQLVVSRGLANTARVPRLFNSREVVYLLRA